MKKESHDKVSHEKRKAQLWGAVTACKALCRLEKHTK